MLGPHCVSGFIKKEDVISMDFFFAKIKKKEKDDENRCA